MERAKSSSVTQLDILKKNKIVPQIFRLNWIKFFGVIPFYNDWYLLFRFVGFNSVDLCRTDCTWKEKISLNLYPIDAGTHSGDNFLVSLQNVYLDE